MSFATSEKLTKGDIACDMHDGGWGEVMQLETIVLQEPAEEGMDWKPDAPQQVGNKAHPFPLVGLGKFSTGTSLVKVFNPARTGTRSAGGGIPVFGA